LQSIAEQSLALKAADRNGDEIIRFHVADYTVSGICQPVNQPARNFAPSTPVPKRPASIRSPRNRPISGGHRHAWPQPRAGIESGVRPCGLPGPISPSKSRSLGRAGTKRGATALDQRTGRGITARSTVDAGSAKSALRCMARGCRAKLRASVAAVLRSRRDVLIMKAQAVLTGAVRRVVQPAVRRAYQLQAKHPIAHRGCAQQCSTAQTD
jgi:hypothetical protein